MVEGNAKRGKDIKCFEDLHPEIQANIKAISDTNEEFQRRVANAIRYQHLFPDRYEPQDYECTGVVTGKPGDDDYDGVCTPEWIVERKVHV